MNLKKIPILNTILFLMLYHTVNAADLVFTPATPIVEINKTIQLSVTGTSGQVIWNSFYGRIQGEGTEVTYVAPSQAVKDAVTVIDETGNHDVVGVIVTLPQKMSLENAQWEIFTDRSSIEALELSEDGKILWIGTKGGLEKWDISTSELKRIFLSTDGLPSNHITALLNDEQGGLWIGTEKGLANLNTRENINTYEKEDKNISDALGYLITVLLSDKENGVWVGTKGGDLAHYNNKNQWTIHTGYGEITNLAHDNQGGLWIKDYYYYCFGDNGYGECEEGIEEGGSLIHLTVQGKQLIYDEYHCSSDDNYTGYNCVDDKEDIETSLFQNDKQDELWIDDSGLIHLGKQDNSIIFTRENKGLLNTFFNPFLSDKQGGLWIAGDEAIIHMDQSGKQEIYHEETLESWSSIISDKKGGVWYKIEEGLVHLNSQGKRAFFDEKSLKLSNYEINTFFSDGQDGLWIYTQEENFGHLSKQSEEIVYSEVPINFFLNDDQNGSWISTKTEGLIHLDNLGKSTTYDIELPFTGNLYSDEQGGVWVANYSYYFDDEHYGEEKILTVAHSDSQGQWTTYEKVTGLSDYDAAGYSVQTLFSDAQGGLWIVTDDSFFEEPRLFHTNTLIHLNSQGQWKIYKELGPTFHSVFMDEKNNLWIAMSKKVEGGAAYSYLGRGLAHLNSQGELKVYTKKNSELPDNFITKILGDKQGGVWVVTTEDEEAQGTSRWGGAGKGLAHLSSQGKWTVYTEENTILPSNSIASIVNDEQGGLWLGAEGELAHLTFGRQTELCTQNDIDAATCQSLQTGKRAAILISGGGAQADNSLWDTTENLSNRFYKTLYRRGFNHSDIYYLSPKLWADFDGDGFNDRIVDVPNSERDLTLEDLHTAFEWAKTKGTLDQPLYFYFMDHGGKGTIQLSPHVKLSTDDLKTLLDDYQTNTGNEVVLILEACHSGSFLEPLKASNRAIITSAKAEQKAYFVEKEGFSSYLAKYLLTGASFHEAFNLADRDHKKLRGKEAQTGGAGDIANEEQQTPQLDDNSDGLFTQDDGAWLKTVFINGDFKTADITLAVENLTPPSSLNVGQATTLQAKATLVSGQVERVWAILRPPKIHPVLDPNGTPILAYPRLNLAPTDDETIWQTTWNDATYNGDYHITFYAKDNDGNIASSELDTVLTVSGGTEPPDSANVQILLEKDSYQRGELFKAELVENLGWGFDLYAAVVMPDGNFLALKNTNEPRAVNEAQPWYGQRQQNQSITLFGLTLPSDLPTGEYCLYGILSPEQANVFETLEKGLWVYTQQCFEVAL